MNNEIRNMLSAVLCWAWGEGMEADAAQVENNDVIIAQKDGQKIAFVTEFDKSKVELKCKIASIVQNKNDFIYVVTNDNAKRQELLKIIPDYCGILFYGDPFGLGSLYIVLKEPKQRK